MTKSTLLEFQERAVNELIGLMTDTWVKSQSNPNHTIESPLILASPTGSGKTIMVTEVMQTFKNRVSSFLQSVQYKYNDQAKNILEGLEDGSYEPIFVFVSPSNGALDRQSASKISEEGSEQLSEDEEILNVEHWDSVSADNSFDDNTVLVLSWDKVNRKTNRTHLTTENSVTTMFNLIVRKTRKNSPVIMFIDESHKNDTRKSKAVIEEFRPDILVKVSATPKESAISTGNTSLGDAVMVSIEEARKEKLIKETVMVMAHKDGVLFNRDTVLDSAIKMQQNLEKALETEDIRKDTPDVPLVLIQIENDKKVLGTNKTNAEIIWEMLVDKGIPEDEIAIWLSDNDGNGKRNIDINSVEKVPAHIKYLIFKTAIATGWDCPRAHILVKLRNVGSKTLDIQTIGRIVRKANNKIGVDDDYENAILKPAYIFVENGITATDFSKETAALLGNFIVRDAEFGEVKDIFQTEVDKFNGIGLLSDKPLRARPNLAKLTPNNFRNIVVDSLIQSLKQHSGNFDFSDKPTIKVSRNKSVTVEDMYAGQLGGVETDNVLFDSDDDAISHFFRALEKNVSDKPLYGVIMDSFLQKGLSKKKVVKRDFFTLIMNTTEMTELMTENGLEETSLSVSTFFINNPELFDEYTYLMGVAYKRLVRTENSINKAVYKLPQSINVNTAMETTASNYLYNVEPSLESSSTIESAFANYLRENDNVKWWFKNASSGSNAFGLYFLKNSDFIGYFPDFIFETTDGKLYIVDTKEGTIDSDIKDKYKTGKEFEAVSRPMVQAAEYSDLVVSMVMRTKTGRFSINTSNLFEHPSENNDIWEKLTF